MVVGHNHIKSYEKEKVSLPGVKKALGKYEGLAGQGIKSEQEI